MRPGFKLAKRAAALGTACFLLAALSPSANAKDAPPPIYDGSAIGQGVVTTFSVRPSIFDPLLQTGGPYSEATLSSQADGASHAIAAQIFPGKFAIGAVGCAGLKGWVQANYPRTDDCLPEQTDTVFQSPHSTFGESMGRPELDTVLNTVLDRSSLTLGKMRARAVLLESLGDVRTSNYELRADPSQPPVLSIEDLRTFSTGMQDGSSIVNETTVVAQNVSILNGTITIGTLTSHARTSSDGLLGTADATLDFTDVRVLINGKQHRATIGTRGVRIDDPALGRDQDLTLQEQFDEGLSQAHVKFYVGAPTEIVNGATAEASVGGFGISVAGTVPTVPIPSELAPALSKVIEQIPTNCINDFEPEGAPEVPLCFGPGVLPGSGSEIVVSLTLAAAQASTIGAQGYMLGGGGDCASNCPGTIITDYATPPPLPNLGPGTVPPQGGPATPAAPFQQPSGPLLGIFANLPASVLLWVGVILLILAVGAALGPSLRHARAG